MTRKKLLKLIGSVCLVLVLCALPFMVASASGKEKPIKMMFAYSGPGESAEAKVVYEFFVREVNRRSEGRIAMDYVTEGALGAFTEVPDKMDAGIMDVAPFLPDFFPGRYPLSSIVGLPFFAPTSSMGSLIWWELYRRGWFDKEFAKLKPLVLNMLDLYHWFGTKKITKLADIKGTTVRVPGKIPAEIVKRLGGTPIFIDCSEMFLALEKGTVDMAAGAYGPSLDFGILDVTKYVFEIGVNSLAYGIWMRKDTFNSLPPDLQDMVEEVALEANYRLGAVYDYSGLLHDKNVFIKHGTKITQLSAEEMEKVKKLVAPMWDEWIKRMEAKGLPGQGIADDARAIRAELLWSAYD